ncbi:MAG: hypothetical protein J6L88_03940, partial [Clostridia bacterium]|nr:hypothetical protein [Clostridia bacterium]
MAKKRVATLALSIALLLAVTVGGTLAYLTDTDSDVNVMTLGNVKIEQIEQQLGDDGETLVPFEQGKDLYPGTSVSKIVSVKNTGKSDAYFRTLFAFEDLPDSETFGMGFPIGESSGYRWSWGTPEATIVVDGVTYQVYEAVYTKALAVGETSAASLTKVEFAPSCTNEDMEALGGTYDILVLSQAVQVAGFEDQGAAAALDTAFGDVNYDNAMEWFGGMYVPDYTVPYVEKLAEDGVVELKDGERLVLDGDKLGDVKQTVTVKGNGTLYLRNIKITAAEGSALVSDENSNVELVIENDVTLQGAAGGNGIYVPGGVTLDLSGKGGNLTAIGGGGTDTANGGSGIGGEGIINIHGLNNLVAEGYGVAGFGIGGASTSITIKDTHIERVQGGYVQQNLVYDTKYGKSEPEGGAAIGSMTNGAVITLENVSIENALGGSKSAGIGARYWTGVTVNITDCTIDRV